MTAAVDPTRPATVTLKLGEGARERLKLLAEAKRRSAHYLMKEVIERYLDQEEAQQAILKSVDAKVANFEANGKHITLDEVKSWAGVLAHDRKAQLLTWHA